jgi:hypothetical protein
MRLFLKTGKRDHKIIVQPGKEFSTSNFVSEDGTPITFVVDFIHGEAKNVRSDVGQYLLDKDMVQRSPIITDLAMARRLDVMDERVRTHRMLTSQ